MMGLRVNMDKTKILVCRAKPVQSGKAKCPCGVCGKGVDRNSILCTQCGKWIHKRCSRVKGSLESCKNFKCGKCLNVVASDEMPDSKIARESTTVGLEFVDTFCYLGNMLSAEGGVEQAVRRRVRCAWGKFKEFMPSLTMRGTSLKVKGKMYKACVQSVMM